VGYINPLATQLFALLTAAAPTDDGTCAGPDRCNTQSAPTGPAAVNITAGSTVTLTIAQTGTTFTINQNDSDITSITLPSAASMATEGIWYRFMLIGTGIQNIIILTTSSDLFIGTITDTTAILQASGTGTLYFVGSTAHIGDCIDIFGATSNRIGIRAVSSSGGGITNSPP